MTLTGGRVGPADPRTLFINATVAGVLGAAIMVLLHELAHLVTGVLLGLPGTLYSYGVTHGGSPSPTQLGVTSIAAPVFSLLKGALMVTWQPLRARRDFWHLLWLMVAFTSMMEGIGYAEISVFGAGDTADAIRHFGWPGWVAPVMLALGVAGQFGLARIFAPMVGRYAGADKRSRLAFTLWPWLAGTAINLALVGVNLSTARTDLNGGEMVAIAMAGVAVLVWMPMALIFPRAVDAGSADAEPLHLRGWPVVGLVAIGVMIVVNQLLNLGLSIG